MQIFTDGKGDQWSLEINVGGLKRVKAAHKIDLTKISQGDPPVGEQLTEDLVRVAEIICTLLEPKLKEKNVSPEEFAERLSGPGLGRAMAAFWQEITDFFQGVEREMPEATAANQSTNGNSSTASPESSGSTPND